MCVRAGSPWRVWSSARPRYDNDVRYQFVVYTRDAPAGPAAGAKARQVDMVGAPPVLPPGVASKHDEYQVSAKLWCCTMRFAIAAVHCYQAALVNIYVAAWVRAGAADMRLGSC